VCRIRVISVVAALCGVFLSTALRTPDTVAVPEPTYMPYPTDTPPPALSPLPYAPYTTDTSGTDRVVHISSPNRRIQVAFMLDDGIPYYRVSYSGRDVIRPSKLGFTFKDAAPLNHNLTIVAYTFDSFDETWTQPWGEVKEIRNHYNELRVELEESTEAHRRMTVVFRVYDDGLGFRYELPRQDNLSEFEITDEETEFALTGNHRAWWIPAYRDNRYEYLYRESPISLFLSRFVRAVHTPLTMETADGLFLSIHEANLTDYASMTLAGSEDDTLLCDLVPWSDGVKVKASTPHQTPWRTIQIAENAGDLITSYLILNLNEPNALGDVSWVQPGKYVGIWWGMHIDKYTWGSGDRHGATTERAKRYIDFAAQHGFSRVLVEGWNEGWDGVWTKQGDLFSFTTPVEDFDI
jgi:alpha-glucosidase